MTIDRRVAKNMSARRKTANRLTLFRQCGACGKSIVTTADTPWVRQVPHDGKKQAITYYCSEKCFAASYKHIGWYDGKAEEHRKERERNRKRVYTPEQLERKRKCNRDYMRQKRRENPDLARLDSAFYRKKRKLLKGEENRENCSSILCHLDAD